MDNERTNTGGTLPSVLGSGAYIDQLYARWKDNPKALDRYWDMFFQGFELAVCPMPCMDSDRADAQSRVNSMIFAYRNQGHLIADLDPLGNNLTEYDDLKPEKFGFSETDMDTVFDTGHLGGPKRAKLGEILAILKDTYCGTIGVEYLHIQDINTRRWLQSRMEPTRNKPDFSHEKRIEILELLIDAELFESFTQSRYAGHKRFSLEGAESLIPALHAIVEMAPDLGGEELVIGMSHRGRLNVLANILDKSLSAMFSEFEDNFLPYQPGGAGDVKYHLGYASRHINKRGKPLEVSLTANPSHLEAVDPVVLGRVRAKQRKRNDTEKRKRVIPLLVHGEAAFAGQGLVAEIFNLSSLTGYRTGGVIHLIINNQIGFTTLPSEGRSTRYATEVAKMIEAPIFHVNADDPEAVVFVSELALEFRQTFGKDVVIDLICYRRHGHQEVDEPAFTQPVLYEKIRHTVPVRQLYAGKLSDLGVLPDGHILQIEEQFKKRLSDAVDEARNEDLSDRDLFSREDLDEMKKNEPFSHRLVNTGVGHRRLKEVISALTTIPDGFNLHRKIARSLPEKREAVFRKTAVDWSTAEQLAVGSLLSEGIRVRLSGQDSARGTFSQRHAVWQDTQTQQAYIPLDHIREGQPKYCIYNSPLSEAGILGFDFGYTLDDPDILVMWEAQFGDFSNGAQVIVDQFITSSYAKWGLSSGIVLLLPHGYEGQGPEHSNAYLERYLAACAEENIQVCYPTTPAQYFHLLRRQVMRPFRRPLILMTPKSLLRNPAVNSPVDELIKGHFVEILSDPSPSSQAQRLLLCSGKIYYDLVEFRASHNIKGVDIVRMEQLYPVNRPLLRQILSRYKRTGEVSWVQEESKNRGAWSYMVQVLKDELDARELQYVGRPASASPATGSYRIHLKEQQEIIKKAFQPGKGSKRSKRGKKQRGESR